MEIDRVRTYKFHMKPFYAAKKLNIRRLSETKILHLENLAQSKPV
jgi:hypothetical protein